MDFNDLELEKHKISKMNNEQLTDYLHSSRQIYELARNEVDMRLMRLMPELTKEAVSGATPVMKILILKRFGR